MVLLRNVNLRSPSECQFALTPGQDIPDTCRLHDIGTTFLGCGGRGGGAAGLSRHTYLQSKAHKRVLNAANGWRQKKQRSQSTGESTEEQERVQK